MNLHEYQAKLRFAEFGIPIPHGKVATTAQQVYQYAKEMGGVVAVKAQILAWERGKAGGVKVVQTADEAKAFAETLLGQHILGHQVRLVLVEPAFPPQTALYLGIINDRTRGQAVIIAALGKDVDFEVINQATSDTVFKDYIDPFLGLHDYQARSIASWLNLPYEHWKTITEIAHNLYNCFVKSDALLAEINPLAITNDDRIIALDSKMVIDDNALFRHKDLNAMRDLAAEQEIETLVRETGISYVKLNGQIGCMVNGAGLAMTTMDLIKLYGGETYGPANFLDIGGGARSDRVAAALRIILQDTNVKSVLINIFGGVTRCDEVANGILQACNDVRPNIPLIVRLQGTNAEEGLAIIDNAHLPTLTSASTLTEAAEKAVAAAKRG